MRPLLCLSALAAFAAAPPAKVPPEVLELIDQLSDDDTRKAAETKLAALGEDVVPALRRAAKSHADADVRLRAVLLAAAIEKTVYAEKRRFTGHTDGVHTFALSPDGKRMVSSAWAGFTDKAVRVWDVEAGKELFQLEGHVSLALAFAFSPDGKRILSGGFDHKVM